jgi:hypothetical protein
MSDGQSSPFPQAGDDEPILFVSAVESSGFKGHSGLDDRLPERVKDLRNNYNAALAQIASMVRDSDRVQANSELRIKEVSVALGFDARGKLGFIAGGVEAGVSATITVTLSRAEPHMH